MKKQLLINILFSSITQIEIPAWGLGICFGITSAISTRINDNLKK